ncbi:MAG: PhoH family protein, partial [Lachnospiraceae bacterium]|nr:PhoH family protein [Lachnospiraceae bacterium]
VSFLVNSLFTLYYTGSYIILDEAQNTTPAQMKMFLTRIGFGSKVVITGDSSQKDLAPGTKSGLDVAQKVLAGIDDIAFCTLTSRDVVRHPLVQKIVKAYEVYEERQARQEARNREKNSNRPRSGPGPRTRDRGSREKL